jgi:diguanylate cyclase (GGDEF)-like protein
MLLTQLQGVPPHDVRRRERSGIRADRPLGDRGPGSVRRDWMADRPGGTMRRQRWIWLGAAILLVVVGTAGSFLGASVTARDSAQKAHQTFVSSSMAISSRLGQAIQQENSLVVSAKAMILANPEMTNAQFLGWVHSMQVTSRYPEVSQLGFEAVVRPAQVSQFIRQISASLPYPLAPGQTYQVTPAGNRAFYCLTQFSYSVGPPTLPVDFDTCSGFTSTAVQDEGFAGDTFVPYTSGSTKSLAVIAPVFPGDVVPATAQARVNTILGLVGVTVSPNFVLHQALKGHPGTAVVFHFTSKFASATFKGGSAPAGAMSYATDLPNGWQVVTSAVVTGAGITANPSALAALLGGLLVSILLAALIYALGTGRSRAMSLVRDRTQELHHLALHDTLTGLPNRSLILQRVEKVLVQSQADHIPIAAFFLDLDNFKEINDTLGHAAGDQLLVAVGTRLTGAIRQEDAVGRLGGDEFVIVAEGSALASGIDALASRILQALELPFQIAASAAPLTVTASIGIAEGWRATANDLLRDADIALYQAKAAGKSRYVLFAPSMQAVVEDHRNLQLDLNLALALDQFFLVYQPVVDLASGEFTGVEALLRWRHPTRGVVQPDQFIPELESSGLIVPVGKWVLEEACRQGAIWQSRGHRFDVSINVSARQLEHEHIVDDVRGALDASGLDPATCMLELTESTLMHDVDATVIRLALLKTLGVRLAVDDFGTGYSSLAYLRKFPIDVLKIDRSFVSGITDSEEAAALVRSIVQLGKALHLETVAEGVENHEQRRQLALENVESAQGFLFARPLDVDAIDRLLEEPRSSMLLHSSRG